VIFTWGLALAPALVAALLLAVPGLIVNLGLGARGFDALGLAPLTSLGVLAIATLLVPVVVGRWSLAAVSVSLALLTAVAVLGRIIICVANGWHVPPPTRPVHTSVDVAGVDGAAVDAPAPNDLVAGVCGFGRRNRRRKLRARSARPGPAIADDRRRIPLQRGAVGHPLRLPRRESRRCGFRRGRPGVVPAAVARPDRGWPAP